MNINLELSDLWKGYIDPVKVEKKYNVKFVCETPIKDKGVWREPSSLIFYGEKHPQGSNYMALSLVPRGLEEWDLVITDGISSTEGTWFGIIDGDEVIYSRYRHDYRVGKTGVWIDGGRDYIRSGTPDPDQYVTLGIVDGELVEVTQ
jgi:hypothetical protein